MTSARPRRHPLWLELEVVQKQNACDETGTGARYRNELLRILSRRPYHFWLTAALVCVVGTLISLRNFANRSGSIESSKTGLLTLSPMSGDVEVPASAQANGRFQSRTQGNWTTPGAVRALCLSLSIVCVGSLLAGLCVALFVDQNAPAVATIDRDNPDLPFAVVGCVPLVPVQLKRSHT